MWNNKFENPMENTQSKHEERKQPEANKTNIKQRNCVHSKIYLKMSVKKK